MKILYILFAIILGYGIHKILLIQNIFDKFNLMNCNKLATDNLQ